MKAVLPFLRAEIKQNSTQIGKEPSDGNRPPDAGQTYGWNRSQEIGEKNPGPQRNNSQNYRNAGVSESAEQAVEKKQTSDATVTGSFNSKILNADGDNFRFVGFDK